MCLALIHTYYRASADYQLYHRVYLLGIFLVHVLVLRIIAMCGILISSYTMILAFLSCLVYLQFVLFLLCLRRYLFSAFQPLGMLLSYFVLEMLLFILFLVVAFLYGIVSFLALHRLLFFLLLSLVCSTYLL